MPHRAIAPILAFLLLLACSSRASAQSIITLNDLNLGPNDVLPALVGGLTPGQEHDQYLVLDDAILGGRLDLQLINGFQPQPATQIRLINAPFLAGEFDSHFLPTPLPAGVALELFYPSSASAMDVRFVPVQQGPAFISPSASSLWTSTENWQGGQVPTISENVELVNSLPVGNQLVQILSGITGPGGPVQVHGLRVEGNSAGFMTLRVGSNAKLSTTENLTVDNLGRVRILGGGQVFAGRATVRQGGLLAIESGKVTVGQGGLFNLGRLYGDGTVEGNVTVGSGGIVLPGTETRSPTGLLQVLGNYAQKQNAVLEIDIEDNTPGEFDEVQVFGTATIQGKLTANFAPGSVELGDEIQFFNADQFAPNSFFEEIETLGLPPGLYGAPRYQTTSMSMLIGGVGDMNLDFAINQTDVDLFALALRSREDYFNYDDGFGPLFLEADITGDTDFDGDLDFDDIDDMIALLPSPVAAYARQQLLGQSIPEPASGLLLLVLGVTIANWRTRARLAQRGIA